MSDIPDYVNDYLKTQPFMECGFRVVPAIVCADGFTLSVQASSGHYARPRKDFLAFYTKVEVGFPSEDDSSLFPYGGSEDGDAPDEYGVYAYVPVDIVNALIHKHGGPALYTDFEEVEVIALPAPEGE